MSWSHPTQPRHSVTVCADPNCSEVHACNHCSAQPTLRHHAVHTSAQGGASVPSPPVASLACEYMANPRMATVTPSSIFAVQMSAWVAGGSENGGEMESDEGVHEVVRGACEVMRRHKRNDLGRVYWLASRNACWGGGVTRKRG